MRIEGRSGESMDEVRRAATDMALYLRGQGVSFAVYRAAILFAAMGLVEEEGDFQLMDTDGGVFTFKKQGRESPFED